MKIAIIGTGYVGLVSGACFAEMGITVTCVDSDEHKITLLEAGQVPIHEPGLAEIVARNRAAGRLYFTRSLPAAMQRVDAVFIAVGTPPDEDGSADLRHVLAAAREIGECMTHSIVVITKSTVPVGTNNRIRQVIAGELARRTFNIPFDIASNPEFLKEGDAVNDFLAPDRVVIGIENDRARQVMDRLYHALSLAGVPLLYMDILSAEMTKYAANSMLATRISFINDIANLCELVGADVESVKCGIGSDSRVGNKFLNAGCGYGGSCFPKDVKALIKTGDDYHHELHLLKAVERINERQKGVLFTKISRHFGADLRGLRFAIWGLAFKPGTDDTREAPSLALISRLLNSGATVRAHDPVAMTAVRQQLGDSIEYAPTMYDALDRADALVIVTEWAEYKVPKFTYIEKRLGRKIIFDGRNIYDPRQMREFGYTYYSIGR